MQPYIRIYNIRKRCLESDYLGFHPDHWNIHWKSKVLDLFKVCPNFENIPALERGCGNGWNDFFMYSLDNNGSPAQGYFSNRQHSNNIGNNSAKLDFNFCNIGKYTSIYYSSNNFNDTNHNYKFDQPPHPPVNYLLISHTCHYTYRYRSSHLNLTKVNNLIRSTFPL